MRFAGEAWELIYRKDGLFSPEPFPRFPELSDAFRSYGCQRLLDLGCGTGRHVVALARMGFRICGFDYSPTALLLARDWLREESVRASLVRGDSTCRLPFRNSAFDGVLSTQVIHHARLKTIRATILELRRVLCPGGLLFVTVGAHLEEGVQYEEIEPGTFLPSSGDEAGVPHHIFSPQEFQAELNGFRPLDLTFGGSAVLAFLGVRQPHRAGDVGEQ